MQQWLRFSAKVAAGFLSVWLIFLPATVHSLGFGNIKMKSALNEPLRAEIELISATPDDVKALTVKLASREAFLRAGVDRSTLLARLRFEVVKRSGKYYVILKSTKAIREPFLNFLLEMSWKSGRMLREYTVLLDPPGLIQKQQVGQKPETTPAVVAPEPMPAPEPMAAAPEPLIPAPEPIAAPEPAPKSPFLEAPSAPAPAQMADSEPALFPAVPLDQAPQVPVDEAPAPALDPMPAPEPVIAAPEPIAPAPEPIDAPFPMEEETGSGVREEFAETGKPLDEPKPAFEEDEGLFPHIPLRAYSEAEFERQAAESAANEPADVPEHVESADFETAPEPFEPVGELDYGITQKGDNLWTIAEKLKPSEQISVYQIMMALQQSNPQAFINGNIHRLKEGQVMRIDDASLLTEMSKEQAAQQYQMQTQVWEEHLASIGAEVPRQAIVAGQETAVDSTGGTPSGELTLATPQADDLTAGTGGEASSASAKDTSMLRQQVRTAMNEASAERQKNTALNSRLGELEVELKRLENLVNIKDSDLAALQRKLDEFNAQRAVAAAEPAPEAAPEPAPEPAPVADVTPEPEPAAPAPVEPAPVVAPTPVSPEPMATETKDDGIMATITGILAGLMGALGGLGIDPLIVIIVVVVVVLLVGLIIWRKKRSVHFQESILTGGDTGEDSKGAVLSDGAPSRESSLMGGESSFLSDFAISGVSAIQAEDSEVDPLTEADVFMAYGRYEAAEERLQEAIGQDASRGELRVKLLELYNTTKNQQAFETAAEDFYAALGDGADSDPLWQKAVAMGSEIAPGNPLFSGAVASGVVSTPAPENTSDISSSDIMDIGLDTGVFNTQDFTAVDGSQTAPAATDDSGLDFSLGEDTSETEVPASQSDTGELDFSLDLDDSALAEAESNDTTGIDFSMGIDSSDESTQTAIPSDSGLDFDSVDESSMEFSLDTDGGDDPTATDIRLEMDSDASSGGMDMNLDASDASAIDLEMPEGGDEVGTKLDLARAYIDMGDPDGARSILDEVMDEGDDGQKQEAQQLLSQIG